MQDKLVETKASIEETFRMIREERKSAKERIDDNELQDVEDEISSKL